MTKETMQLGVKGVVSIQDDLGNTILDKQNAIHPQNVARIIARALASESSSSIYKLALGRGGTFIDATGEVSYRRANDGIMPDAAGWQSALYDETYSVVVATAVNPDNSVVSTPDAQVVVTCKLAKVMVGGETQLKSSLLPSSMEGAFVFDELGLFTSGAPRTSTQGYQDVSLPVAKYSTDATELLPNTTYAFDICVDQTDLIIKTYTRVSFTTPTLGGSPTYEALAAILNGVLPPGIVAQVSQPGVDTQGKLRFRSTTSGALSAVYINPTKPATGNWLFSKLTHTDSSGVVYVPTIESSVIGKSQGTPDDPNNLAERMLTHLIFSPLQKDASREWTIKYTLTIVVQQSDPIQ